jgi:uncharacterized protein (DUF305 family)
MMMHTMTTTIRTLALGALLALGATSIAQGQHGAGHGHGAPNTQDGATGMGMGPGGAMGPGMPMASQATDEAGFLTHMIPHHQEAVDTARALLEVTERPQLRALLEGIIASQTAEIEAMESWLEAYHPEAPRDLAYEPMMRDLGPNASVEALERAFLEDMVMHHMMAVRDARMLLMQGLAEHEEVATLARSIVTEQMTEIEQMRTWLADWFGVTMPMGRMLDGAGVGTDSDAMGHGMMRGDTGMLGGMMQGGMMQGGMMQGGMMQGGMGMMGPGMMGSGMMGPGMAHHATDMGMHGAHGRQGTAVAVPVGVEEAARLAQAFLDGRGDGNVTGVEEPVVTFEVRFDDAQGGGVLIVDARTGAVRLATER